MAQKYIDYVTLTYMSRSVNKLTFKTYILVYDFTILPDMKC